MNGSNETASKNTIDLLLSIEMYEEYCRKVAELVDIVGIGAQR